MFRRAWPDRSFAALLALIPFALLSGCSCGGALVGDTTAAAATGADDDGARATGNGGGGGLAGDGDASSGDSAGGDGDDSGGDGDGTGGDGDGSGGDGDGAGGDGDGTGGDGDGSGGDGDGTGGDGDGTGGDGDGTGGDGDSTSGDGDGTGGDGDGTSGDGDGTGGDGDGTGGDGDGTSGDGDGTGGDGDGTGGDGDGTGGDGDGTGGDGDGTGGDGDGTGGDGDGTGGDGDGTSGDGDGSGADGGVGGDGDGDESDGGVGGDGDAGSGPECTIDDDCGPIDLCNAGTCQAPACLSDAECDNGQFCDGQEFCVPLVGCLDGPDPQLDDGLGCTVGACDEVDDQVTQTPDDGLCTCAGSSAVGVCLPGDGGTGPDGCACLTPAELSCEALPEVGQVLDPFALSALAPGAAPGATFLWELVGTPVGGDPSAHLLEDADQSEATFTPTQPSADPDDVYTLMVTLQEPNLAPQTCLATLEAEPLPDEFQVTLFMYDGLDVDIHVVGGEHPAGEARMPYDFRYHPEHTPSLGDDRDRECGWFNCTVCTVEIPGQWCTARDPRIVDFDLPQDGASLADPQDPQLDIDNMLGCYDGESGEPICVPEKVTVEQPQAGVYYAWSYLWGMPLASSGELTTPLSTDVDIEVSCRGQTKRYTRTLSSEDAANPGQAAAARSFERIAGANGFVRFEVPSDPGAPCILP